MALLLVAAGTAYQFDLGERLGVAAPDPSDQPGAVAPPEGLTLPVAPPAPVLAAGLSPRPANPAAVSQAVSGLMADPKLGRRVTVAVGDGSGQAVFAAGPSVVTPASTMKLLSGIAALKVLGPDKRFATTVVHAKRRIVLVGGGDPLLTRVPDKPDAYPQRADLTTLAQQTATALTAAGITRVRLGYAATLFTGPAVDPTWEADYIPDDVVSPIVPLWVDEGRVVADDEDRSPDPTLAAAQFFAAALAKLGISMVGEPEPRLPASAMQQIATVLSPPVSQIVQHTLEVSDNEAAEVLTRHVGLASGGEASFVGGTAAIRDVLTGLGVDLAGAVLNDGSGLSRSNRLGYRTLLDLLRIAAADPALRVTVTGLPVAGFSGSLLDRFEDSPTAALGEVRAKTGTLTGVHLLAGTVVTRDGVLLSFVAAADRVKKVDQVDARAVLADIAAALAACACSAG